MTTRFTDTHTLRSLGEGGHPYTGTRDPGPVETFDVYVVAPSGDWHWVNDLTAPDQNAAALAAMALYPGRNLRVRPAEQGEAAA